MRYLGSHISLSSPSYYASAVQEALSYGETAFMFYTGAPQNSFRKDVSLLHIEEGRHLLLEAGLDESKIIVHAPYILNLASKEKEDNYEHSIAFLQEEIRRVHAFHLSTIVLHPGSHLGKGEDYGIATLSEALLRVLEEDLPVDIALETMAGKGNEVGSSFLCLSRIISACHGHPRLKVCLDTCHVHDAGYDVSDGAAVLDEFDEAIGLGRLAVVHLNDSKNPRGSHKDRHANLGLGEIGFDSLLRFASDPRLKNVPIILETPYVDGKPPYAKEIEMLRSGRYEKDWIAKL